MNKLEKIDREAKKARDKIAAMQTLLKQIEGQRTEQENLQIIEQIRALKLSRDELYTFLNSGTLPETLLDAISSDRASEQETIYSRRGNTPREKPVDYATEDETGTTEDESEDTINEE